MKNIKQAKYYFLLIFIIILGSCYKRQILSPTVVAVNLSHCKKSDDKNLPIDGAFSLIMNFSSEENYIIKLNNDYSRYDSSITHYILFENGNTYDTINIYSHHDWEINRGEIDYGNFYLSKKDLRETHERNKKLTKGIFLYTLFQKGIIYYENKTTDRLDSSVRDNYKIIKKFTCPFKSDICKITYRSEDCQ
jgi:hypothetical protein|tara:strand:+ start:1649 stop:2224 length:576 start_codon:yes stop_codon:yes gene_type:complete